MDLLMVAALHLRTGMVLEVQEQMAMAAPAPPPARNAGAKMVPFAGYELPDR